MTCPPPPPWYTFGKKTKGEKKMEQNKEELFDKEESPFLQSNEQKTKKAKSRKWRKGKSIPIKEMTREQLSQSLEEGKFTIKKCGEEAYNDGVLVNAAIKHDYENVLKSNSLPNYDILRKKFAGEAFTNYMISAYKKYIKTLLPAGLKNFSLNEHCQFGTVLGKAVLTGENEIKEAGDIKGSKLAKIIVTNLNKVTQIIDKYNSLDGKKENTYKNLTKEYSEDPCFIAKAVSEDDKTYTYKPLKAELQDLVLQLTPSYYNLLPTYLFDKSNKDCVKKLDTIHESIQKGLARYTQTDSIEDINDDYIVKAVDIIKTKQLQEQTNLYNQSNENEKLQKRKAEYLNSLKTAFDGLNEASTTTEDNGPKNE